MIASNDHVQGVAAKAALDSLYRSVPALEPPLSDKEMSRIAAEEHAAQVIRMKLVYFITHPDVVIDPAVPVPQWPLSARGRERMEKMLAQPWIDGIGAVYCSTEQKAIDGAEILAGRLAIGYTMIAELGETDRSSTAYLPKDEHSVLAQAFFAQPETSVRGWERAIDAQRRIVRAVESVIAGDKGAGDITIVSHGGVGTLYLCHLKGRPISWDERQPGANGGCYFCFAAQGKALQHGWQPIDG